MKPQIAIIKLGALGDVVRTTSILKPLQQRYPGAKIWWWTLPSAVPLLERNPCIKELLKISDNKPDISTAPKFDLVISLDEDLVAASLSSSLQTRERFGTFISLEGKVQYTPSSRRWFDMSLLNRDADGTLATANRLKQANTQTYPQLLVEMLGLQASTPKDREPIIVPDPAEESAAAQFKSSQGIPAQNRVIGINTGSGARWVNKQLTIEKTLRVLKALGTLPDTSLVLLGGPEEKDRNAEILKKSSTPLIDAGTANSMTRFISIVNLCDDLVTSDSLALHIGTALRKRVFAFFGPTSPVEIDLYGRGGHWLPRESCRCFYLNGCREKNFCLNTLDEEWLLKQLR